MRNGPDPDKEEPGTIDRFDAGGGLGCRGFGGGEGGGKGGEEGGGLGGGEGGDEGGGRGGRGLSADAPVGAPPRAIFWLFTPKTVLTTITTLGSGEH